MMKPWDEEKTIVEKSVMTEEDIKESAGEDAKSQNFKIM